jgi:hypothetical protein
MKKITNLNGPRLIAIRREMQAALDDLGKILGVKFVVGGRFTKKSAHDFSRVARGSFEILALTPEGKPVDKDREAFESYPHMAEWTVWLDRHFMFDGLQYKVAGYRPRARKRPIVAIRKVDDRKFVFSIDAVREALQRAQGGTNA